MKINSLILAIALLPSPALAEWLNYPDVACAIEAVNVRSPLKISLSNTSPAATLRAYPPNQRPVLTTLDAGDCYRVAQNTGNNTYAGGYRWVLLDFGGVQGWVASDYLKGADY